MEEEPSIFWTALQTRYKQQKVAILPKENPDGTHLPLHDYKTIEDYNNIVQKICTKL
jgi:hypothetical protein